MTSTFEKLRSQNDDLQRNLSSKYQVNDPWVINNLTPSKLTLIIARNNITFNLCQLTPFENKNFDSQNIKEGDILHTYFLNNNVLVPFIPQYTCREFRKKINIGAVTYATGPGRYEIQATHADMRGMWIHNRLTVPINIYFKGQLSAQLYGYNGTEYMGGGASTLYFDNNREGLNFMDKIYFSYKTLEKEEQYGSVTLNDVQASDIYVGVISDDTSGMRDGDPDNAVYSVDNPVYTGLTYYVSGRNAQQYKSYKTNVFAPF